MEFLKRWPARILMIVLLLQAAAYYAVASRRDTIPEMAPLSVLPLTSHGWSTQREYPIEEEVQKVLKADDSINRLYLGPNGTTMASLFVAFFRTQRYGQSPHSPKNCMPGSGWRAMEDSVLPISVSGRDTPIAVNKYVIARGDEQSVVLYWYQSHNRVIARELSAKLWLVADAIRYHRSDTALVRIVVPVQGDRAAATQKAIEFVQAVYPDIVRQLPQ